MKPTEISNLKMCYSTNGKINKITLAPSIPLRKVDDATRRNYNCR